MFKNSIASRINSVLKERIKNAQEAHEDAIVHHTEVYKETVASAKKAREANISAHADQMVESIIGKVA